MKILLAEDDPSIQTITVMALSKVGKHEVVVAKDGLEALQLVKKESPDLILLDVMMPNLNGFDTCTRLKANPDTKDIPIIFLTAKAQTHELHQALSLGAIGCIIKPFNPMNLSQEVVNMLEKTSETPAA